jgi:site-specific DNA recombinase
MIKESPKGLFDVIIVWKLDRFARNRYDSAHYKNILKKNGVKVISATEAISSGAEGILLESMLEGYAEYYSAELAEKINRGLTENAMKCKFNSDPITFGFNFEPAAITSEYSCSEAFLCPNTAFYGGIRAFMTETFERLFKK